MRGGGRRGGKRAVPPRCRIASAGPGALLGRAQVRHRERAARPRHRGATLNGERGGGESVRSAARRPRGGARRGVGAAAPGPAGRGGSAARRPCVQRSGAERCGAKGAPPRRGHRPSGAPCGRSAAASCFPHPRGGRGPAWGARRSVPGAEPPPGPGTPCPRPAPGLPRFQPHIWKRCRGTGTPRAGRRAWVPLCCGAVFQRESGRGRAGASLPAPSRWGTWAAVCGSVLQGALPVPFTGDEVTGPAVSPLPPGAHPRRAGTGRGRRRGGSGVNQPRCVGLSHRAAELPARDPRCCGACGAGAAPLG